MKALPHSSLGAWSLLGLFVLACADGPPSPLPTDGSSGGSSSSGGAPDGASGGASGSTSSGAGGTVASGGAVAGGSGGTASSGGAGAGGANAGGSGGAGVGGSSAGGSSSGGSSSGGGGPIEDVAVFIAGDSTVSNYADTASPSDQAGWGQMLPEIFSEQVSVDNRAAGGRTALWFHLEGAVAGILEDAAPGDYFLVQFGTNDSHKTATFTVDGTTYQRFADAGTTFKTHLLDYYIEPARAADLNIVLVTPPPRNSAYCGTGNSLGGYAQAMRELGEAEGVAVLDLNTKTFDHLAAICPSPTPEDFFFLRPDSTVDGTHFQENGARHMAGFLGECITEIGLDLAPYLVP